VHTDVCFSARYSDLRDLLSFPTRRSSDLGSPLVIGIGQDEFFLASDATPIVEYTKEVVYLNDQEVAVIRDNELSVRNTANLPLRSEEHTSELQSRENLVCRLLLEKKKNKK